MRILVTTLLLLLLQTAVAQRAQITWIEVSGNKVIVHYSLEDNNPNHLYLLNLFSSQDNFTTALSRVSGDVGPDIKPGADKTIVWDITRELGEFNGTITLEIRGRVFVPYVKLTPLEANQTFKRGKNVQLTWISGNPNGQVNIELFKGQDRYPVENNIPNSGRYDWHIPASQKKGSGYKLRFTNPKDRNDFVESTEFSIKPKIPMVAKAVGFVAIGVGAYFIIKELLKNDPLPTDEPLILYPNVPDPN